MADWIKIEKTLPDKLEVLQMATALEIDEDAVVGKLIRFWRWVDDNLSDCNVPSVTYSLIDRIANCKDFAKALVAVGWLEGREGRLSIPHFDRHFGQTAKTRAVTNKRVEQHRKSQKAITSSGQNCNAASVTTVTPEALPEKEKENRIDTEGRGNTTVDVVAAVEPPLPPPCQNGDVPESFRRWREALCAAVPQLAAFRTLPPDVELAARQTYNCLPQAADYAPLLAAYYADRMPEDSRRVPFWRPMGAQFFRELADVIFKHARRWQKETGWRKTAPESHENAPKTARKGSGGQLQRTGGKNALEAYQKRMNEKYGINDP